MRKEHNKSEKVDDAVSPNIPEANSGQNKPSPRSRRVSSGHRTGKTEPKIEKLVSEASGGQAEPEQHPLSPQERGRKGISHGMSPHDRGVLGAQARWSKVRAEHQEKEVSSPSTKRGG